MLEKWLHLRRSARLMPISEACYSMYQSATLDRRPNQDLELGSAHEQKLEGREQGNFGLVGLDSPRCRPRPWLVELDGAAS